MKILFDFPSILPSIPFPTKPHHNHEKSNAHSIAERVAERFSIVHDTNESRSLDA